MHVKTFKAVTKSSSNFLFRANIFLSECFLLPFFDVFFSPSQGCDRALREKKDEPVCQER